LFGDAGLGRVAVINSLANVSKVEPSDIKITQVNCTNEISNITKSRRRLKLSSQLSVNYELAFKAAPENVTIVYASITEEIESAQVTGVLNMLLETNSLPGAKATSVTFSPVVTYAPSSPPTRIPSLPPVRAAPSNNPISSSSKS